MPTKSRPNSAKEGSHQPHWAVIQSWGRRGSAKELVERWESYWPPASLSGSSGSCAALLLGDLKHAEALVLLQKFVLSPDLLPQAVQLLLLLLRAQLNARHGADELAHLLELGFEGIKVLVDVGAVFVHAFDNVVDQR